MWWYRSLRLLTAGLGATLLSGIAAAPVLGDEPVATQIIYTGQVKQDVRDLVHASARLTALDGSPVANETLSILLGPSGGCSGTTTSNGILECTFVNHSVYAGLRSLTVSFAGDVNYAPSSTTVPFELTLEETTVHYLGPMELIAGQDATMIAYVTEDEDGPRAYEEPVVFTITSNKQSQSCVGVLVGQPTFDFQAAAICTISALALDPGNAKLNLAFSAWGFHGWADSSLDVHVTINPA